MEAEGGAGTLEEAVSKTSINKYDPFQLKSSLDEEIAYEKLLDPLWQIWKPIFERELDLDPHPDKIRLNKLLFFQQVLQEHLR